MTLVPTIGLEIHAELKTASKMFCTSKNDPDEDRPNVNICPVCLAHPGTLPVINHEAVLHVLRVGHALKGQIADYTEFDRKNYFYPDLPKGYQISQYAYPLVSGGMLANVAITRIHLEEDTARSQHDQKSGKTMIDYNRAGVPLMELVTDPVIHDAETAASFARELQILLRYLGATDANMEKGEMRVEANISVGEASGKLGTKVEVKNLNSFRSVQRAIEYEVQRQSDLIASGGVVAQETRGWDEAGQKTFSQRVKEQSADYRYFPDPDLPKLILSTVAAFSGELICATLPELPATRYQRYLALGISPADAEQHTYYPEIGNFLDMVLQSGAFVDPSHVKTTSNYVVTDLVSLIRENNKAETDSIDISSVSANNFAKLMKMTIGGKISSRATKDILKTMLATSEDPEVIAEREGALQRSDESYLIPIIRKVFEENPAVVSSIKSGKVEAVQFLVGQVMKASKGAANPIALKELILANL